MEKVLRNVLISLGLILPAAFSFGSNSNFNGQVLYDSIYPMSNVYAYLYDAEGNLLKTDVTNPQGQYHFNNLNDGTYTVKFSTDEPAGGIDLIDAYDVMLYLLGSLEFTEFELKVADVNGDGDVNWDDYNEILYSYLNEGNPFSGGDWVFDTVTFSIPEREGAKQSSGGSTGDVNGTFLPPTKYGNCFVINTLVPQIVAEISKQPTLDLQTDHALEITGLHLVFKIPQGITIDPDAVSINTLLVGAQYYQEGDLLRVTWMNQSPDIVKIDKDSPIVEFAISSNNNTRTNETLNIQLASESHIIGADGGMLPFTNFSLPGVKFEENRELAISENIYPNPFVSYVQLDYYLPADGKVKIMITNNLGQLISIPVNEYEDAGSHSLKIDGSGWPSGLYYYNIQFSQENTIFKTGSMIKSK